MEDSVYLEDTFDRLQLLMREKKISAAKVDALMAGLKSKNPKMVVFTTKLIDKL